MKFHCLVLTLVALALVPFSHAQNLTDFANPCNGTGVQRTIEICTPVEGGITNVEFLLRAKITDSSTTTWSVLYDGLQGPTGSGTDVIEAVDYFNGTTFGDWHKITVQAKDSQGTFERSVFVKTANDQLCAPPAADQGINVCTPIVGETISNPVHMSASATISDPQSIIIYIDGVKAARNSTENQGTGLTISQYLLLTPGTHQIVFQLRNANVAVATQTVNVTVAE